MFFIFILAVFLNTVRMDWEKRDSGEESKKWHDFNDRGLGFALLWWIYDRIYSHGSYYGNILIIDLLLAH